MGISRFCRGLDLVGAFFGVAIADVVRNGFIKKQNIPVHNPDAFPKRFQRHIAHIVSINENGASGNIVKPDIITGTVY